MNEYFPLRAVAAFVGTVAVLSFGAACWTGGALTTSLGFKRCASYTLDGRRLERVSADGECKYEIKKRHWWQDDPVELRRMARQKERMI